MNDFPTEAEIFEPVADLDPTVPFHELSDDNTCSCGERFAGRHFNDYHDHVVAALRAERIRLIEARKPLADRVRQWQLTSVGLMFDNLEARAATTAAELVAEDAQAATDDLVVRTADALRLGTRVQTERVAMEDLVHQIRLEHHRPFPESDRCSCGKAANRGNNRCAVLVALDALDETQPVAP